MEEEREMDIVVIYSLNTTKEKIEFWKKLKSELNKMNDKENLIIMGDFNSVESPMDRYPQREEEKDVLKEWEKIRKKYKLIDGWREHNQTTREYTYSQKAMGSMSRIDRIYLNNEIYPYGYNWQQTTSAKISDHELVLVDILKKELPYIGKGMWRMYQDNIDNLRTKKKIETLLKTTKERMEKIKQAEGNESIQRTWKETKENIKEITIKERRQRKKELKKEKNKMKRKIAEELGKLTEEPNETNRKRIENINKTKSELAEKTKKETRKLQEVTKARYRMKGEKCNEYWFKLNKEKINSNIILGLKNENETLTRQTEEMKEIARKYHEKLQKKPTMNEERKKAIGILKKTAKARINEEQKKKLEEKTTKQEIKEAICKAPNRTSPGIDGIPYELQWLKKLLKRLPVFERLHCYGMMM